MEVCIADHGRFFGEVFDLAVSNHFEVAAMPGEYCGFGAGEGVGLLLGEFCAEEFCVAGEEL